MEYRKVVKNSSPLFDINFQFFCHFISINSVTYFISPQVKTVDLVIVTAHGCTVFIKICKLTWLLQLHACEVIKTW